MDFTEKTLRSEVIFKGNIIDLYLEDVLLVDGNKSKREIVKHPGAVALVSLTPNRKLILVEQYRKPLNKQIIEIPAGKIEENEIKEITAHRELEEETGYQADKLTHIQSFYTSPGFADELIHLYYTGQVRKLDVKPAGDADEFIKIHEVNLKQAEALIAENKIMDAKTIYAIMWLKLNKLLN